MRVAFVADIHGHLTALEAVIADIRKEDVQTIVCLGDVATLGTQPAEVISLLAQLDCSCVRGNHESALFDVAGAPALHIAEHLLPSLYWTLDQMSQSQKEWLQSFQPTITIKPDGETCVLCYHGTPTCNHDGIYPQSPEEVLAAIAAQNGATVFVGAHTHQQMIRDVQSKVFLNPGSVGSVFRTPPYRKVDPTLQAWAEYGILDLEKEQRAIILKRIPFDVDRARESIRTTDNPLRDWWKQQYK